MYLFLLIAITGTMGRLMENSESKYSEEVSSIKVQKEKDLMLIDIRALSETFQLRLTKSRDVLTENNNNGLSREEKIYIDEGN